MKRHSTMFHRFDYDFVNAALKSTRQVPSHHEDPDPDWQPV